MDKPANDFTIVPNEFIRDNRLDASGLALLVYLHHLPESWVIVPSQLAERFNCSRNKIVRILTKLNELGYVECHQPRNSDGHFSKRVWKVSKIGVPVKRDAEEWTLLSTNNLLKTKDYQEDSTKTDWREALYAQKPECCSVSAWKSWIDYKIQRNKNRPISKRTVTMSVNQLKSLHAKGFDLDGVIEVTINKNWQGIGDETYKPYERFKRNLADDLLVI